MALTDVLITGCGGLLSYLVGSVPFGYLAGRLLAGVDIRIFGSGNIGATNVARVFGGFRGVLVFLGVFFLDVGKGVAAAGGLAAAARAVTGTADPAGAIGIVYGLMAIAGHVFPVWLGFRGGKAVATSCGVMFALAPVETAGAVAVWVVVLAAARIVSLASVLAALGLVAARFAVRAGPWRGSDLPLTLMMLVVAALVVVRHHANIRRLIAGTEPRIGRRRHHGGSEDKAKRPKNNPPEIRQEKSGLV